MIDFVKLEVNAVNAKLNTSACTVYRNSFIQHEEHLNL